MKLTTVRELLAMLQPLDLDATVMIYDSEQLSAQEAPIKLMAASRQFLNVIDTVYPSRTADKSDAYVVIQPDWD